MNATKMLIAAATCSIWTLASAQISPNTQYYLDNANSGLAVNVSGASTVNGAAIIQWPYDANADSIWTFVATDSGYYQIVNANSGRDIVVQSASTSSGANIIQWSFGSAQNDQWKPVQNSDGSYTFHNRKSGLALEVPGDSTAQGVQLDQWTDNGGANQKFTVNIVGSSGGGSGNIAPNGTAYGWFGMSSSTGTANQTAQPGLNDNNLTANVDLEPAGGAIGAWEAGGVIWSSPVTISSADFINGDITTGGDGFLTANLKLQFTTDGTTWTDSGWTASPAYPYSSSAGGQTYAFSGTAVSGVLGARVVGQVRTTDTSYHWILKEVQFTGSSGGGGTPDFSLSASPNSLTITQGANGTSTISVNPVNGYNNTVSLSASGLPSGVTASFNPGSTTSGSTLTLTASATAATGSTTVTISGTDGTLTHTTTISLTVAASGGGGLPAGWTDADIGSVGLAGSASYSGGTFTVSGSGNDIWSTSDAFNYAYQSVSEDQTIVAHVVSVQNTASWAKSGIMVRVSTSANATYVAVYVTPANGVSMQIRPSDGASAIDVARQTGLTAPYWVKIVRSGNTFTGYSSPDGSTWTEVAATNVTMASGVDAGLAVCAHNNTALNTSTFDNVSIAGPAPDFSLSASPGSLTIVQGNNGTSTITINPVNGYNNTVSLSASGLPSGVTASFNPGSTTSSSTLTLTSSSTAATGSTTVTITGTDGTLTHTTTISLTIAAASSGNFSGWYQVNDRNSGKDAVVRYAALTNGADVVLYTFGSSGNDVWELTPTDSGYYKIINYNSSLVMAVQGASTLSGAKVIQWSFGSAQNDQWMPVSVGGDYYKLVNRHSGLVLDVAGGGASNGTAFDQAADTGAANQQFQFISTPESGGSGSTNYTATQVLSGVQKKMTSTYQINTEPHINTMTRAMNVNVYQVGSGVFAYTSSMAIDDDGIDPDPDPDHQSQTTWTDDSGQYLGAHHVAYYVLGDDCWDNEPAQGGNYHPCPHFYYADHNITGLQFALIFYNGKVEGAVFGDTQGTDVTSTSNNDSRELGEASVMAAYQLGIPDSGTTGGVTGGVTVVIFSGSQWVVHGSDSTTLNNNAQAMIQKALNTLGPQVQ